MQTLAVPVRVSTIGFQYRQRSVDIFLCIRPFHQCCDIVGDSESVGGCIFSCLTDSGRRAMLSQDTVEMMICGKLYGTVTARLLYNTSHSVHDTTI